MKDRTTIVADNKEELKTCTSQCYNTPECQKTTTAKTTTKETTTSKYPIKERVQWTSGFVPLRTFICDNESPYGREKYERVSAGMTKRTCRGAPPGIRTTYRGKTNYSESRKYTCYYECTTDLIS